MLESHYVSAAADTDRYNNIYVGGIPLSICVWNIQTEVIGGTS